MNRNVLQRASFATAFWYITLAILFLLMDCGGRVGQDDSSKTTGGGTPSGTTTSGQVGGSLPSGVAGGSQRGEMVAATGGSPGITLILGSGGAGYDAGVQVCACGWTPDVPCNEGTFWEAVMRVLGFNPCSPSWEDPSGKRRLYAVILDSEGQVVDNTRLSGSSKESWIASVAMYRWPCLADQSLEFFCTASP